MVSVEGLLRPRPKWQALRRGFLLGRFTPKGFGFRFRGEIGLDYQLGVEPLWNSCVHGLVRVSYMPIPQAMGELKSAQA